MQIVRTNHDEVLIVATFSEAGMIAASLQMSSNDEHRNSEREREKIEKWEAHAEFLRAALVVAQDVDDSDLVMALLRQIHRADEKIRHAKWRIGSNDNRAADCLKVTQGIWEIVDEIVAGGEAKADRD